MKDNRSAPPGAVVPKLIYDDVAKAMDWLCNAFGFTVRLSAGDASGSIGHAQLNVGDGAIMLGASGVGQGFSAPDSAILRQPRAGEVCHFVHVRVDDVDAHCERARRFGARILQPPESHMYGERQYTAEDFAGHRWTFSQTVEDIDPESWGARVGHEDGREIEPGRLA